MEEQLISLKTAKLAKEIGFKQISEKVYVETLEHTLDIGRGGEYTFSKISPRILKRGKFDKWEIVHCDAPTQSLLQKWLREVHNIIVYVTPFKDIGDDLNDPIRFKVFTTKTTNSIEYKTYEEALEIGLQEALKLIK